MTPASFLEIHNKINEIGSKSERTPKSIPKFEPYKGKKFEGSVAAYSAPAEEYGVIGLRKFRPSR